MHDGREARAAPRLAVLEVQCSKNVERFERYAIAWVSGVSGEKGKDGSEKGRELKERNAWHRCFY